MPDDRSSQISQREWIIVVLISLLTASLLTLPYILGHLLAPDGVVFTGLMINVEDTSYLSIIRQGRAGAWVYRNLFTTEEHAPIFIQGFYLSLGHLARLLGVTAVTMWHLARWLADATLFILLYGYIARFIKATGTRAAAFALAVFGSGFDWVQFSAAFERPNTLEAVPMDLFTPETHLFFSALTFPHFIAGIILIMLIFWLTMEALTAPMSPRRRWRLFILAGIGNLLLGLVYPFLIFLITAVLGLYYLRQVWQARRILWPEMLMLAVVFVIPIPLFSYYAWAVNTVEVFKMWNDQAVTLTPHPVHLLLAYGPYLILGGLALKRWKTWSSERKTAVSFLICWVVAVAILLYIPLNPQRRFVEGLQIPLSILAAIGLFEVVLPRLAQTRFMNAIIKRPRYTLAGMQRLIVMSIVLVISLASLYIYAGTAVTLTVLQPYPFFRPLDEVEAMDWLGENTAPDDVVLGEYWSGSYIPPRSGNAVFVGHWFETVDFATKRDMARQFFADDTPDSQRVQLLQDYQIAYVFYGRSERYFGDLKPEERPYLELAYMSGETAVYRVLPNKLATPFPLSAK
ncbi:MAG: hypothetical protein GY803_18805 [Chloroflexi bacterium]|nr:hypothetical protein [Chloroflexota bacterium]